MRALVVYESMYGATRAVARAIGDGIGARLPVVIVEVADAPLRLPDDVGLLVVGGPTHARGMSGVKSRAEAVERAGDRALVSRGRGIREWLAGIEVGPRVPAASFDTRFASPSPLWGSAAQGAAARLEQLGFPRAAEPKSFLVSGPTDSGVPGLLPGELERARAWGAALVEDLAEPAV
jgi:hypothetical protein